MSGVVYEYRMVAWLFVFSTMTLLVMGLLGIGQIQANEIQAERTPNIFEGIEYFFTNPFTTFWAKFIYTVLIISPLVGITSMAAINGLRGRS